MENNSGKGFSIASLVLGILAIVFAWFYMINIAAVICGIVGIALAIVGRNKSLASGVPNGIGTAGLVLSIIGTVLAGIGFISCTVCVWSTANSFYNSFRV